MGRIVTTQSIQPQGGNQEQASCYPIERNIPGQNQVVAITQIVTNPFIGGQALMITYKSMIPENNPQGYSVPINRMGYSVAIPELTASHVAKAAGIIITEIRKQHPPPIPLCLETPTIDVFISRQFRDLCDERNIMQQMNRRLIAFPS